MAEHDEKVDPPAPTTEPPAPAPPAPPAPPEPPTTDPEHGDLREAVKGLSDVVTGLVTTVQSLVENSLPNDKVPTKVPWTHRGGGRK